jgi:hypothetical protein
MKYFITILLITSTLGLYAQKSESFLLGSWKTVDAIVPEGSGAKDVQTMKAVKPYMLKTTFRFDASHRGSFVMPLPGTTFDTKPTFDIYWIYNPENRRLTIKEWKDRSSTVAEFFVIVRNGDVSLASTDGPMIMKVKKVK